MGQIRKVGDIFYIEFHARGLMYSQIAGHDFAAAQKLLEDIETKIAGGEALTIVRDIDLAAFLDQFLNEARSKYSSKTFERFNSTARHFSVFIKENLSHLSKLSQITPSVFESYKAQLMKAGISSKKVNLTILLLREMMENGIKTGFINDNPTLHVRLMPMRQVKRTMTPRLRIAQELLGKGVGLPKTIEILKLSDIAKLMYYSNLIPLSREDMYNDPR